MIICASMVFLQVLTGFPLENRFEASPFSWMSTNASLSYVHISIILSNIRISLEMCLIHVSFIPSCYLVLLHHLWSRKQISPNFLELNLPSTENKE